MLRSVFTKTIWDRRKSLLWWTVGSVAITAWIVAVYPVLRDSADMQAFIDQIPPEMMAIAGIDPATYLTGAGYLQAQLYSLMAPILMIGFAVSTAVAITSREEHDGTLDMLLSAPISRTAVALHKVAAVAVSTAIVASGFALTLVVANPLVDLKLSTAGIVAANLGIYLVALVFAGMAMAIGAFTGKPAVTLGLTLVLAVLAWFMNAFESLFSWLEIPSKVSPFTWYLHDTPLINGLSSGFVWLTLATMGLIAATVYLFSRRDIATEAAVVPEIAAKRRKSKSITPRRVGLLRSVFSKSLWDKRRSIWGWAGGLGALLLVTFAAWPALSADPVALEGLVNAMPKEMLAMFGMTDAGGLATPAGFISSRTYQSIGPVVLIVFVIGAVSTSITKEEAIGQMDMVLSTPRPRRSVLVRKAMAIAALVGVIVATLTVVGVLGDLAWDTDLDLLHIVAANVGIGLLGLFFGGVALALWGLLKSAGPAIGITIAVAVAAYFLNGLGAIVDVLEPVRPFSPFFWYLGDSAPLARGFGVGYLLLAVGALAGLGISVWRFETRDLAV
jgi:ABC-2 type transport system permease protein